MKASINLGRIWGIPIGLHISWFLIFALITLSLSTGYFPNANPQFSGLTNVILGLVTSLFFFGSVLAHELGHSFVAIQDKIPVRGITLFIFGGVAQIGEEPRSPGSEFRIAIAGPIVSLVLAGLFGVIGFTSQSLAVIAVPSLYLARINLILAVFNLIPGFPLDGGRVLRAFIWWLSNSYERATKIAARSGQVVAYGFIGIGIISVVLGQISSGLWLAFIGWFLQNSANSAAYQLDIQQKLRGATVGQAMSRDCATVYGLTPLSQLVQGKVLTEGQHCFFVIDSSGQPYGMLTLRDITQVPQTKWRFTTAEQVMKPLYRLLHLDPSMELLAALKQMDSANLSEMPVIYQNRPVGMLSRERVMRYLRLRNELGM